MAADPVQPLQADLLAPFTGTGKRDLLYLQHVTKIPWSTLVCLPFVQFSSLERACVRMPMLAYRVFDCWLATPRTDQR